jgi:Rieske Fe-S protein
MPRAAFVVLPKDRPRIAIGIAALAACLALGAIMLALFVSFAWPQGAAHTEIQRFDAGYVNQFAVGEPVTFPDCKCHVVRKPDGSFVALYWKDPHLGCTVPWRETFTFTDPRDHQSKTGWFRDPCYGSTYDRYGTRVFGPSPRDLDRLPVWVDGDKVYVDTNLNHLILGAPASPYGF